MMPERFRVTKSASGMNALVGHVWKLGERILRVVQGSAPHGDQESLERRILVLERRPVWVAQFARERMLDIGQFDFTTKVGKLRAESCNNLWISRAILL